MNQVRKERVAILGCGLIGDSWAALMTAHGHDVVAWDPAAHVMQDFLVRVEQARAQVREVGALSRCGQGRLRVAETLDDALSEATWVQENAPESLTLKLDLYSNVERLAADDTIIASSTSSLTWSELATDLDNKRRFITAHPFNPPHLMPLVEVYAVHELVRQRAVDFYAGLGRRPVVLQRDAVGHIANRLASALWREAVNIVAEGIADVSAVDAALVHGPGLRWSVVGAHLAYHLGGGAGGIESYLKHLGPSQERRWASLGTPILTPELCAKLVEGVRAETAGRSIEALERDRNRSLIRVLEARDVRP